jgi:DNA-binding NarL/FixJ family response regulator
MLNDSSIRHRNIMIAEDHNLVARLVKEFLLKTNNSTSVSIVNDETSIFDKLNEDPNFDLIILDLLLGPSNAIESINKITTAYPAIKIIVLSSVEDKMVIQKAFALGASGYILKTSRLEEITEAIDSVLDLSEKYYSREVIQILLDNDSEEENADNLTLDVLTERQKEILKYILEDYSNDDIADRLCISKRTIETHRRNIMNKLNVKSKYALLKLIYNK